MMPVGQVHGRIQWWVHGVRTPLPEKLQKYRVSYQYWSGYPEKIIRLPSQHTMLGHHQHASETPFKWYFAGGPMLAPVPYGGIRTPPPPHQLKNASMLEPF